MLKLKELKGPYFIKGRGDGTIRIVMRPIKGRRK